MGNWEQTKQLLSEELMMVIGYTFANDNMANYPPGYNDTRVYKACTEIFTSTALCVPSTEKSQTIFNRTITPSSSQCRLPVLGGSSDSIAALVLDDVAVLTVLEYVHTITDRTQCHNLGGRLEWRWHRYER